MAKSRADWRGWFEGVDDAFLTFRGPRLLIAPGPDCLDATLLRAQMRGAYEFVVIPEAGHVLHEDAPDRVAAAVLTFLRRFLPLDDVLAARLARARAARDALSATTSCGAGRKCADA